MAKMFISYSRKDSDSAHQLVEALSERGDDYWIDFRSIPESEDCWREICAGIDSTDNFVFIISPDALISKVCNREVLYAREQHKRIIPVIRRDATVAGKPFPEIVQAWFGEDWEQTAESNWKELQRLNWLFFRVNDDFETAFARLIQTSERDLEHLRTHTRLLVRARQWEAGWSTAWGGTHRCRSPAFWQQ